MNGVARLVAVGGPDDKHEYSLEQAEVTLGRHPASPVAIGWDASVSREHARIFCRAGLFWVEDLGSKRGTFLALPDGPERRLVPHQPEVLLDGETLRLGLQARFRMVGGIATDDEAVRVILSRLQEEIKQLCAGLPHLVPLDRDRQLALLEGFVAQLKAAQDEPELLHLAAEGIPTLGAVAGQARATAAPPQVDGLPPLPDALPDPDDPNRLRTIHNVFVANLRACFQDEQEGQGGAHG